MVYNKMAGVYDRFMENAPYDQWTSFTKELLTIYQPNPNAIIDLGCGTGQITLLLAKLGFEMTGVDFASDMLSIAQQRASEENIAVQWIQQDLNALETGKTYDVAISYCDVMNYITKEDELQQVFSNVYQTLSKEGLFLFDVHAISYVENDLQDNTFSEMYEDMGYVWFCDAGTYHGEMYHDMTFFVKDKEQYERFDEQHHQRTFPTKDYLTWLRNVGFDIIGICSDFDTTFISPEQADQSQRIFIICRK
ncbi:Ubiquinone biosynthesis O-methyltransferase [Paraliobacillus sp. PM-2]|uniref:class I SAM-dependent DNA methyltransferase n=1 Tax=Paraliobacillus sp. PM-2 TaxID=1462524 RepID=UPI00061CA59D|nr:class I SAM-dependent methyltransferase [Paraliobacillus sp. PM-2]CQR46910.1 Ubiquinone biosynthesis O-methyltransferase [Paraliobacillus sp. PM-2]